MINIPQVVINQSGLVNVTHQRILAFKRATEEILLPVINRKTIVHFSNICQIPLSNGCFHIFVWSAAMGGSGPAKVPNKLFGLTTNNTHDWNCFKFTDTGIGITDGQSDYILAEIIGDNLYIHLPIFISDITKGVDIYRKILEQTVVELTLPDQERQQRDLQLAKDRQQRQLKFYVEACRQQYKMFIRKIEANLADQESTQVNLQKQLIAIIRNADDSRRQLLQIKQREQSDVAIFEAEYNKLVSLDGVESVRASEDMVIIDTGHIYITTKVPNGGQKKVTFDIGKFRIEIYLNGQDGGIKFFNTTRKGTGDDFNIQHPHINKNGIPCLGNIKEIIAQLIAEYQFAAIALLALEYLETVNFDDGAGSNIVKHWPIVENEPKEINNV